MLQKIKAYLMAIFIRPRRLLLLFGLLPTVIRMSYVPYFICNYSNKLLISVTTKLGDKYLTLGEFMFTYRHGIIETASHTREDTDSQTGFCHNIIMKISIT